MRQIVKSYPGVRAVRGVDLQLHAGEIVALLGENGAGKSTLIKILGGAVTPDSGEIVLDGSQVKLQSPADAQRAGVAVIYQEFNLIPGLSASANIFLGREQSRAGFIRLRRERHEAQQLFQRLGARIPVDRLCRDLTVAQQQIVEIAKALSRQARILVLDEPTAALTTPEVQRLFTIVRELKAHGLGIIYISHRLEEIFELADRVMVLRDGQCVDDRPLQGVTKSELIERMVGRPLTDEFPPRTVQPAAASDNRQPTPRLEARGLVRGQTVRDVSFTVGRGEIVALTGLIGSGRTEAARLIFGADRRDAGEILLDGVAVPIHSPRDAIHARIGFLTEDRKLQGLILQHSVRENFGLPNLSWLARFGFVNVPRERQALRATGEALKLNAARVDRPARNLSGGNQQKLVLAKWLARRCEVLLFDEPTRGIDVGAKYEIYQLIHALAAEGKGILIISSELPEVLGLADRILVMHDGCLRGEIRDVGSATQEQIMELAVS